MSRSGRWLPGTHRCYSCLAASRVSMSCRSAARKRPRGFRRRPAMCRSSACTRTASSPVPQASPDITTQRLPRSRCELVVNELQPDDVTRLTSQLQDATTAARHAYRDTGRLIRLLTVLSSPSAPDELLGRALAVLSEAFNADIVCVVSVVGERFFVTAASGLAEDDASYVDGWTLGPAAYGAVRTGQPVSCEINANGNDVPLHLAGLGLRSAAFIPMSASSEHPEMSASSEHPQEVLVLYRSTGEPFGDTDLH